jgi:hypothetical protein
VPWYSDPGIRAAWIGDGCVPRNAGIGAHIAWEAPVPDEAAVPIIIRGYSFVFINHVFRMTLYTLFEKLRELRCLSRRQASRALIFL